MGIISDYTKKYTNQADQFIDDAVGQYGKWIGRAEEIKNDWENAKRDITRSWVYDNREAVSGEAKALHPFQFADLTPLRWLGVTRLPLMGAKGVQMGVKAGKALSKVKTPKIPATWKTLPKTNKKSLKRIGASAAAASLLAKPLLTKTGKTLGKSAEKTLNLVKKNPKKTIAAGTLAATLLTRHSSHNNGDEDSASWIARRRVSRRTWI